jgi:hypothetical protein
LYNVHHAACKHLSGSVQYNIFGPNAVTVQCIFHAPVTDIAHCCDNGQHSCWSIYLPVCIYLHALHCMHACMHAQFISSSFPSADAAWRPRCPTNLHVLGSIFAACLVNAFYPTMERSSVEAYFQHVQLQLVHGRRVLVDELR